MTPFVQPIADLPLTTASAGVEQVRTAGGRVALGPDDVHVWFLDPAAVDEPTAAACAEHVLAASERAEVLRYRAPADRRRSLLGRALARCALSRYAAVPPGAWPIVRAAHGRPELARAGLDLRFNVAHTEGLIACAVARGRDVGVDVEARTRRVDPLALAEDTFAAAEIAALLHAGQAQRRLFFDLWTLKEAYVKARGRGLSLPLDGFAFRFEPAGRLSFADTTAAGPPEPGAGRWAFALLHPTPEHAMAVAARGGRAIRLAATSARLHAPSRWRDPSSAREAS